MYTIGTTFRVFPHQDHCNGEVIEYVLTPEQLKKYDNIKPQGKKEVFLDFGEGVAKRRRKAREKKKQKRYILVSLQEKKRCVK